MGQRMTKDNTPRPNRAERVSASRIPLSAALVRYNEGMASVEIYTTNYCGYCTMAKRFFEAEGIPFTEIDVTGDDAARAALVQKAAGRRTVPQIFIDGTPVGGYTDMMDLHRRGELARMLGR